MKPSDYLKQDWCQNAVILRADGSDSAGDERNFHHAIAWSLAGAVFASKDAGAIDGSKMWAILDRAGMMVGIDHGYSTQQWNDDPSRTQEEVVDLAERVEEEVGL